MFNGRRTSTTTILSLSIFMLLMMIMIKDCHGWMAACNGSTAAECRVVEDEEQEFMMDTEEHRRILAGNNNKHLGYGSLQKGSPACGNNCGGRYDPGGRKCKLYNRSCR
ncbi:putative rapid ALkalinization Factor [Helianthus annuus]|nr:putative rapid ALkalinization Factor [Helianthus annuus]KAJ0694545.1 putative rapid ALkalinization Factor [Helianthus annuus]KAJ0832848.1 putative rapid ALkalinization Factor [Helianthus annuus]KAJ0846387.1 putative rapid ALkalinization Factor [Helianthus annuus]